MPLFEIPYNRVCCSLHARSHSEATKEANNKVHYSALKTCRLTVSWATGIQFVPSYPISLRHILTAWFNYAWVSLTSVPEVNRYVWVVETLSFFLLDLLVFNKILWHECFVTSQLSLRLLRAKTWCNGCFTVILFLILHISVAML
jgi:hypothetical protein